jgi:predicted XRE-type DNA-binding protein
VDAIDDITESAPGAVGSTGLAARLTQAAAAAEVQQIDQPKVSALVRGRLTGFSLDRLVRFLVLLGSDVEIVVKPRAPPSD